MFDLLLLSIDLTQPGVAPAGEQEVRRHRDQAHAQRIVVGRLAVGPGAGDDLFGMGPVQIDHARPYALGRDALNQRSHILGRAWPASRGIEIEKCLRPSRPSGNERQERKTKR